MRHLVMSALLLAARAAFADGCDLDSYEGIVCAHDGRLDLLVPGVGSVRELAARVKKAGYRSVVLSSKNTPRLVVRFDENGNYVRRNGVTYRWDDGGRLTQLRPGVSIYNAEGSAGSCRYGTTTCRVEGDALAQTYDQGGSVKRKINGRKIMLDGTSTWFEQDEQGRWVFDQTTRYRFEPKQTVGTYKTFNPVGTQTATWTLNDDGLPARLEDTFTKGPTTYTWSKAVAVRVIDGACPGGKGCKNPEVERLSGLLAGDASFSVSKGDPAKKERTQTEVWFQDLYEDDAKQIAKTLGVAADPTVWTWGGDFDVLVIAGPPPAK